MRAPYVKPRPRGRICRVMHLAISYVDVLGFDVVAEARDVPGWGSARSRFLYRASAIG